MKTKYSTCPSCKTELTFYVTPYMQNARRICSKCGAALYEDVAPINWVKVAKGKK